jgi:hypothetical protein
MIRAFEPADATAGGKIVARIRGGLGNQLFCYAAARRLAISNGAEVVIDDVSGFVRDLEYRRMYMLDRFEIPARRATPAERLEPFERYRRGMLKLLSRRRPFGVGPYLEERDQRFDARLLTVTVRGVMYLDGLWQSDRYFQDIEAVLRDDLKMQPSTNPGSLQLAHEIRNSEAVAVHVRFFDPAATAATQNVPTHYYQRAIAEMSSRVRAPRWFVFSDDPVAARERLPLPPRDTTFVMGNSGQGGSLEDFWLMRECRHFIIANSTFSWWAAWLADAAEKLVLAPRGEAGAATVWSFPAAIPAAWLTIPAGG